MLSTKIKKEIAEYCENFDPTDMKVRADSLYDVISEAALEYFTEKYSELGDDISDYLSENLSITCSCDDGTT
jgi:hypothetical protein